MPTEVTNPLEQAHIVAQQLSTRTAAKRRHADLLRARFGPTWIYVCFAALVWSAVAAGWLIDFDQLQRIGRPLILAFSITVLVLTFAMIQSYWRCREKLLLTIIEEEAAETYRWLKHEKII